MNALETWMVHTEAGSEGPYTREQLRHKIETGRLKPEDKLVSNTTREALPVGVLFPDAVQIARRTTSERIRRTGSSGRLTAATATNKIAAAIADMAAEKTAAPQTVDKPVTGWYGRQGRAFAWPRRRTIGFMALGVIAATGIAFTALTSWEAISGPTPPAIPAPTALDGQWVVDQARLEASFKAKGQSETGAVMDNYFQKMADGFSLTVGSGQAVLKTQQGTTSGLVEIARHPGSMFLIWTVEGKKRSEIFSVDHGAVAWQSAMLSIPLKRAP